MDPKEQALKRLLNSGYFSEPSVSLPTVDEVKGNLVSNPEDTVIGPALATGIETVQDFFSTPTAPTDWQAAAIPEGPGKLRKPVKGNPDASARTLRPEEHQLLADKLKARRLREEANRKAAEMTPEQIQARQKKPAAAPQTVKPGVENVQKAAEGRAITKAEDLQKAGGTKDVVLPAKKPGIEVQKVDIPEVKDAVTTLKQNPSDIAAADKIFRHYYHRANYKVPIEYATDPLKFLRDIGFNPVSGKVNNAKQFYTGVS